MNPESERANIDPVRIGSQVVEAVAEIRCKTSEEIQTEMTANGGNLELSAKEVMAVIAILEEKMNIDELLSPSDFATETTCKAGGGANKISSPGCMDPAEGTTISDVIDKVVKRLSEMAVPVSLPIASRASDEPAVLVSPVQISLFAELQPIGS